MEEYEFYMKSQFVLTFLENNLLRKYFKMPENKYFKTCSVFHKYYLLLIHKFLISIIQTSVDGRFHDITKGF